MIILHTAYVKAQFIYLLYYLFGQLKEGRKKIITRLNEMLIKEKVISLLAGDAICFIAWKKRLGTC